MKADALLRDPGFQLNLLLWMAREQPAQTYIVRPLFHELGFDLLYIENPFPLPEETTRAVTASGLDVSVTPEPDVLLQRSADKKALYIETKASAFSAASSSAKQARGHLLASGPAFAEVMKPLRQCLLCYLVPDGGGSPMDVCLTNLRDELTRSGFQPGLHSVHGLGLNGTDLVYTWDAAFRGHTGSAEDSAAILRNINDDTDPSPLFLIYCDQDYPDPARQDLCRRALQNQVHATLLCELRLAPAEAVYVRTLDQLLLATTDGIFQYIGRDRQKSMRRLIRDNIFKRIFAFWKKDEPGLVRIEDDTLKVQFRDAAQQEDFLDWLEDCKRTDFKATTPPPEEMPLLRLMETQADMRALQ